MTTIRLPRMTLAEARQADEYGALNVYTRENVRSGDTVALGLKNGELLATVGDTQPEVRHVHGQGLMSTGRTWAELELR